MDTSLIEATCQGDITKVNKLLAQNGMLMLTHQTDENDWNALMHACAQGDVQLVSLLLPVSEVDHPDKSGETALIIAVKHNHVAVVDALVQAGANIHITAQDNNSAFTHAIKDNRSEIIDILLAATSTQKDIYNFADKPQALILAATHGDMRVLAALILLGLSCNMADAHGRTLLMLAAMNGHVNVAKLLIRLDANVLAQDNLGQTALIWAAKEGQKEIIDMFTQL